MFGQNVPTSNSGQVVYLALAYSKGYKRIREGEVSQVSGLKCGGVCSMFVRPVGGSCNRMSVRVCGGSSVRPGESGLERLSPARVSLSLLSIL